MLRASFSACTRKGWYSASCTALYTRLAPVQHRHSSSSKDAPNTTRLASFYIGESHFKEIEETGGRTQDLLALAIEPGHIHIA
jgi:hypothetical protein